MADNTKGADARSRSEGVPDSHDDDERKPEKRRSTEPSEESSSPKKISISLSKPAPLANQKISFNLSASGDPKPKTLTSAQLATKISTAPIKMSLNTTPKTKELPPVVQKSAAAAKVFDDSDESDEEEEMPPEAKMRMRNIGRETPTASGPNSYGKGKMGFSDRHKIMEKQMKEEMEKVSGDKTKRFKDKSKV